MYRSFTFYSIVCLSACWTSSIEAAEIAGVAILQDGEHVAGIAITYGGETEAELWLLMQTHPLIFERDFTIPVSDDDPTTATLTGAIEVQTYRRGDPGTTLKTDQIQIVQRGSDQWFVVQGDIERTLKAAGLTRPDPKPTGATSTNSSSTISSFIAPLCIIGALLLVVLLFYFRRALLPNKSST